MDEEEDDEDLYDWTAEEDSGYTEDCDCCNDMYEDDCCDEDCGDYHHVEDSDEFDNHPDYGQDEHHTPMFIHSGSNERPAKIGFAEGIYGFVFVVAMILFFIFFL